MFYISANLNIYIAYYINEFRTSDITNVTLTLYFINFISYNHKICFFMIPNNWKNCTFYSYKLLRLFKWLILHKSSDIQ